ncbi:hypothetical protein C9374_001066 [Naegleria lovaniensis]|uniref:Dihydropteridine reductase n=1 Tax=Naegleria lovaniensis TaxID=51637 RepID=A0AA88GTP1_NAELO|nr:uncharacterized protein C9374_001066 [Naegleria lovaniensis]KAG2388216.1 hypothetical protein C9374_001066 [Naegleria lovaniensis]
MSQKVVAVFGGVGSLGRNLIRAIKQKNYMAISIDLKENSDADHSIVLNNQLDKNSKNNTLSFHDGSENEQVISQKLQQILANNKLDAVVNVAGGFVMGSLKEKQLLSQVDAMWKVSVQSSVLSALIASAHLKDGGLLVLPGAAGALSPTPHTIAYGLAKNSVHHLVRSLAHPEQCGLPAHTTTIGIVPSMLDTEANRQAMPNADTSSWTPLDHVSSELIKWLESSYTERPPSGSLVKIVTSKGNTDFIVEK